MTQGLIAEPVRTPPAQETELLTAMICTRNRGPEIVGAVQTILANTYPHFELLIVDQSTDDRTEQALAPFRSDPRLRYLRTDTQGIGRARNTGLRAARTEIVICTDDDCTVPTNWLEEMRQVFVENPRVILAFCNVIAAPHDSKEGFIPAYVRESSLLLQTMRDKCTARGIGAGVAFRREAILSIGGCDEMLGTGGEYWGCEDGDIAARVLMKGYQVYETARVGVVHYGFRPYSDGKRLSQRDWFGIGAAYSKTLKGGSLSFLVVPLYEFFVYAVAPPIRDLLCLRRPRGVSRITGFVKGFTRGLRTPLDRETLCFRKNA